MSPCLRSICELVVHRPQSAPKLPLFLELRASKVLIIFTVSMAVFVDLFLYAVIVPVIPFALRTRAGVPEHETQYWVSVLLAVYGAALLISSPICGYVTDRIHSRRLPFLVGLLFLAGATLFLALGNKIWLFILGRVLQGASAAIVWVAGLALLVDTVGKREVGQTLGYVSLGMSLAILVAPVLGGVVFEKAGYYAVYSMCFGLLGIDIVLRVVVIEKKIKRQWVGEEGSRAPSIARCDVVTPSAEPSGPSETKISSDGSVSAATLPGAAYIDVELSDHAIVASGRRSLGLRLPPIVTLLSSRRLLVALWGSLVQASLLTALDSTLPLHVRRSFSWNSLGAGLIFLPVVIPTFFSPLIGWLSDRYGPRYLAASGFLFACPFLVLLKLVTHDTIEQKVILCILLVFLGIGLTLAFAPLMAEITYVVESKSRPTAGRAGLNLGKYGAYGQAYALFNIAFAGGCLVGPIWGGMVTDTAGWHTMCWTLGLLSAVTALPTLLWTGGWWFDHTKRKWATQQQYESSDAKSCEPNAPVPLMNTAEHSASAKLEGDIINRVSNT